MIVLPTPSSIYRISMSQSKYRQHLIPIRSKEILQENVFRLSLSSSEIAGSAEPGNFVHLRVTEDHYPLLRRAFSIHGVNEKKGQFDILFKVVGKGTKILSGKRPGDSLDVLGPIGNTFALPQKGSQVMLVAGGMGIAPLWFLFLRLIRRSDPGKLTFFLGAKNKRELVYVDKFKAGGCKFVLATDDGSMGKRGLVTEVFLREIERKKLDCDRLTVYSCGPRMMLKRMAEIARELDFSCQVSLENHMACGVGVCWGCAAKQSDGTYKRVCADGPVFDAKELSLE